MKIVIFIALIVFCVTSVYSTDSLFIYDEGEPVYSDIDTTQILIDWSGGDDSDLPGFLDNHPYLDTAGIKPNVISDFNLYQLAGTYLFHTVTDSLASDTNVVRFNLFLVAGDSSSYLSAMKSYVGSSTRSTLRLSTVCVTCSLFRWCPNPIMYHISMY